jgi:hypothetical protein
MGFTTRTKKTRCWAIVSDSGRIPTAGVAKEVR